MAAAFYRLYPKNFYKFWFLAVFSFFCSHLGDECDVDAFALIFHENVMVCMMRIICIWLSHFAIHIGM